MNILISNDDGIEAIGIKVLASAVSQQALVTVVAPDKNRSGSSSALTLDNPLRVEQISKDFYSVNGTPCDCVHLGSHRIMTALPDMVIAGINSGPNLGDDVMYSGTVAAAMEGRSMGFPAVAISLAGYHGNNYETAASVMCQLLQILCKESMNSGVILNVNVPDVEFNQIKGVKATRLGRRHRADTIVAAEDAKQRDIYWIGPPSKPQDVGAGTDFHAVEQNYVSITPLVVDFTAYQNLSLVERWIEGFDWQGV